MLEKRIKVAGALLRFVDFHFFYRACAFIVRNDSSERLISVQNFKILVDGNDPYGSRLISKYFKYEPELENWLLKECSKDLFFIDCGANIGYWSIFVSKVLGVKSFVCVEPNPKVFRLLEKNLDLNNLRGVAIQAAIGDAEPGDSKVKLFLDSAPGKHVGASIDKVWSYDHKFIEVPLVRLSDLIKSAAIENQKILLKLDVEGAEISCIKQIPIDLRKNVLIIYEDHGRDRESLTTKWLLDSGVYKISFLQRNGELDVDSIDALRKLKKSRKKGYNLVAWPL